jgi:hypothetical protein
MGNIQDVCQVHHAFTKLWLRKMPWSSIIVIVLLLKHIGTECGGIFPSFHSSDTDDFKILSTLFQYSPCREILSMLRCVLVL